MEEKKLSSNYQQYLPAILQEEVFLGRFLLAFEKILSGLDETPNQAQNQAQIITGKSQNLPGLEEIIDLIHLYFNPQETPEEFLPWLAGWVALSLRDDWKVEAKRAFIQKIVGLYSLRGTKQGLIEILGLYLKNSGFEDQVEIFDEFDNFPHYFQVQITSNIRYPNNYWQEAKIAKAIIDREKPAQTYYTLKILMLTMQITKRSQLEQPLNLSPVLKICRLNDAQKIIEGNTIFQRKSKPYGMRITDFLWTQPYCFQTFAAPKIQDLQPDITAIIEKIELEAIVEITEPNLVTTDLLNKITVRLKDDISEFHLLTPETRRENKKIIIKRTLYYQQFMQTIDKLTVTIKNINNVKIKGKVIVQAWLIINQHSYNHILLEKKFNLDAVPPQDILQICRKNEAGKLIEGKTIPTIIGTSIKSFN